MIQFKTQRITFYDTLHKCEITVNARETWSRNGDYSFVHMRSRYLLKSDGMILKCIQYGRAHRWERCESLVRC